MEEEMTPSQEWVVEVKKKYGKVSKCNLAGETFIFRRLSRKEHLEIQKEAFPNGAPVEETAVDVEASAKVEDLIIKKCVLWPENIDPDTLGAGVAPNLVPAIMYVSGFARIEEPIEL